MNTKSRHTGLWRNFSIVTIVIMVSAGIGKSAYAQAGGLDSDIALEEIIVTAQKREQNLQDVPVAVSVVTAADIESRSIVQFSEILHGLPNTAIVQNSSAKPRINVRGVTSATLNAGVESGVGVQIDDVFLGRPSSFSSNLIDIERIEVLRGPQGTLFGKNTIGGLINIVTRRPSFDPAGAIDVTVGEYDLSQVRGYFTGGLIDEKLAGKVSFTYRQQDGWGENRNPESDDLSGADYWGARAQLLGEIGERGSWLLSLEHSEDDTPETFQDVFSGAVSSFDSDPFDRSIETSEDTFFDREQDAASLRFDWDGSSVDFVSISAYRRTDFNASIDSDYSTARFFGARPVQSGVPLARRR